MMKMETAKPFHSIVRDLRINLAERKAITVLFKPSLYMVHVCTKKRDKVYYRKELDQAFKALDNQCVYVCVCV